MSIKRLSAILVILLVIAVFSTVAKFGFDGSEANVIDFVSDTENNSNEDIKYVTVSPVSFFSGELLPLELIGTVRSVNESRLYAEKSGQVSYVSKKVGDYVSRNQIIAEIENATERAALLQAQGVLDQAKASRDKIIKGSSDDQLEVIRLSLVSAENSYDEAKSNAVNTLKSSFTNADDAIRAKTDILFTNAKTNPELKFTPTNTSLGNEVEDSRIELELVLEDWQNELPQVSNESDIEAEMLKAENRLSSIRNYLSDLAILVNGLQPNVNLSEQTIEGWKANISIARSTINQSLGGLTNTKDLLSIKMAAYLIAERQYQEALSGGRSEDVRVAEASVLQAEGAYALALSNLERTLIRSAVSGTIASINIKQGDFVQAFQPVALVIGSGSGFEIETYITEGNKNQIVSGSEVLIDGRYSGVVRTVASALDPVNKKIEVDIAINDAKSSELVNGETVVLNISRNSIVEGKELLIPISALKIGSTSSFVLGINEEGRLYEIPVEEGAIVGEKIIINEGLAADTIIVVDARGLKSVDLVEIGN